MNWGNVVVLACGTMIVLLSMLRVERRALWAVLLFVAAPATYLVVQWSNARGQWPETITAVALGAVITAVWWLMRGRKLPAPTSDHIKVWGQEPAPRPRPADLAAMQAELLHVKEEKARLEAELRRLSGTVEPSEDRTDARG
jgi:hypothetical protein